MELHKKIVSTGDWTADLPAVRITVCHTKSFNHIKYYVFGKLPQLFSINIKGVKDTATHRILIFICFFFSSCRYSKPHLFFFYIFNENLLHFMLLRKWFWVMSYTLVLLFQYCWSQCYLIEPSPTDSVTQSQSQSHRPGTKQNRCRANESKWLLK